MKVEICASNFESARIAQKCGADRIELCVDLGVGGLTPPAELIERVISELRIPTHVLIRPREGDFIYSEAEFREMIGSIELCKTLSCDGVVSGALTPSSEIDTERTGQLIRAAKGVQFTFHRAFDLCVEPLSAIKSLTDLGVDRLLSSGQELRAELGITLLKQLKIIAEDRIEIMPGGGINDGNAHLFKKVGFRSIHLSAIKKNDYSCALFQTGVEGVSDSEIIKNVLSAVR